MCVHFDQRVREISKSCPARKLQIGQSREVHQCEGDVDVEWLARSRAALHEIDRSSRDLSIDEPTLLKIIDSKLTGLFPFTTFHDVREW